MSRTRFLGLGYGMLLICGSSSVWAAWGGFQGSPEISTPSSFPSSQLGSSELNGNDLRMAARAGRFKRVQKLLDAGVDVNSDGDFGETALLEASRFGHAREAALLIQRGAEVNARNSQDDTALIAASRNCTPAIVGELIRNRADVNWANREGHTALIEASIGGCASAIRILGQVRGLRIDHRDNGGRTALDHAQEGAMLEMGGPFSDTVKALRALEPKGTATAKDAREKRDTPVVSETASPRLP